MSKGEEVRFGELVTNMTTGALAMQWASASIIRNAVLGGAAGGTNTAVTNWMYGENGDVRNSVMDGVFFSSLGIYVGKGVKQIGNSVLPVYFGDAGRRYSGYAGFWVDQAISNVPSFQKKESK